MIADRPLAPGLLVSQLGFGTSQIGNINNSQCGVRFVPKVDAEAVLEHAAQNGITLFDTAPGYGLAEDLCGTLKRHYGDGITVATKGGADADGRRNFSPAFLRDEIAASLAKLGRPIDLYQINKPSLEHLADDAILDILSEAKFSGQIRYAGIIVGDVDAGWACVERTEIDCLQVMFNLIYHEPWDLMRHAASLGKGVIVRSPLNSGLLSGSYTHETRFDPVDERSQYFVGPTYQARLHALAQIQADLSIENDQLLTQAIRFILSVSEVTTLIPAASSITQLQRYITIAQGCSLMDRARLDEIIDVVSRHMGRLQLRVQNL